MIKGECKQKERKPNQASGLLTFDEWRE